MEAIDRSENNRPAAGSERYYEFLSQCRLSRSVYSIDADANRMLLFNSDNTTDEVIYEL